MTLDTLITDLGPIAKRIAPRLKKLGLVTARDLLLYFPWRYDDFRTITAINNLQRDIATTIRGTVRHIANRRSFRKRLMLTEALIEDASGAVRAIWFQQPFVGKILQPGMTVSMAGSPSYGAAGLELRNPSYEISGNDTHTARLVPIYSLTFGLTQKQLRTVIAKILPLAEALPDPLPSSLVKREELLPFATAVHQIHFPDDDKALAAARARLAFDEVFTLQLTNQLRRAFTDQQHAQPIPFNQAIAKSLVAQLPFPLTPAQRRTVWEIFQDIERARPMTRLLEGDVGSGKTAVAALAAGMVAETGWQTAVLAPTDMLARQHFETFAKLLPKLPIVLLTRTTTKIRDLDGAVREITSPTERKKFTSALKNIPLVIGTHTLLQKPNKLPKLALLVIDEQHRFGVRQRALLADRGLTQTNTQTNAEKNSLLYEDTTYKIRGAIFSVKKQIGLGHKEAVYQNALAEEFKKQNIPFKRELSIPISYNNKKVGTYRPDFVIDDKIILELKALPFTGAIENRQTWNYLKGSRYHLALLVNFGGQDIEMKRIIFDTVRNQRESASIPRQSATCGVPHVLSMTATPIPRSLALALVSDLDISILDELPPGRKAIGSHVVPPAKRDAAYQFIRQELARGRQCYVVCPLIDPSDALGVKSATETFAELKTIFPEFKLGLLHSKLATKQKEIIRQEFLADAINMLVATSVVEVGVDVPNATIMLIEGAERFGLAQLWQLRGRVGRSTHQSWCFLFSDSERDESRARLELLVKAKTGFEVAEADLRWRGPGQLSGTDQSGWLEFRFADISDTALLRRCHVASKQLLQKDPTLMSMPLLRARYQQQLNAAGILPS